MSVRKSKTPTESRRQAASAKGRRETATRVRKADEAEAPPHGIRMVPLGRLSIAEENMRQAQAWDPDSESGRALVESIRRHGLLHPPTVVRKGHGLAVVAGGRRLQAMKALAAERGSGWTMETKVQCSVRSGSRRGDSLGVSLGENEVRLCGHYVDRFDQMERMRGEGGQSIDEIAVQLGMARERVVRLLRIERVDPALREDCRQGRMRIDQLEALSCTDDHERQRRVWSEAGPACRAADIRRRLSGAGMAASAPQVRYVGLEEYYRRGGRDDGGLYQRGRDAWLLDTALVGRIVGERLDEACARERAAGWAWAEACPSEDMRSLRSARLDRAEEPEGGWTKEAMKGLGVLVCVGRDGSESVSRGWRTREGASANGPAGSPASPAAADSADIKRAAEVPAGPSGEDLSLAPSSPTAAHMADLAMDRALLVSGAISKAPPERALALVAEGLAAWTEGLPSAVPISPRADLGTMTAAAKGLAALGKASGERLGRAAAEALRAQAAALAASRRLSDDASAERAGQVLSIGWAGIMRPGADYWERVPTPRMVRMAGRIAGEEAERALAASKGRPEAVALLAACCAGAPRREILEAGEAAGVEGLALEDLQDAFKAWPAEGLSPDAPREAAEARAARRREARYAARRGKGEAQAQADPA